GGAGGHERLEVARVVLLQRVCVALQACGRELRLRPGKVLEAIDLVDRPVAGGRRGCRSGHGGHGRGRRRLCGAGWLPRQERACQRQRQYRAGYPGGYRGSESPMSARGQRRTCVVTTRGNSKNRPKKCEATRATLLEGHQEIVKSA